MKGKYLDGYTLELSGARVTALASGALWWQAAGLLAVADLHLGRSERIARLGGALLPPYEVEDTLLRIEGAIEGTGARTVVCLGDTFDDAAAADLPEAATLWLARLMAGRRWIWIAGNHDPGPIMLGGEHRGELTIGNLTFRHIAEARARGEVSGHYHPKFRIAGQARPCFLTDGARMILPAFGTYTGGMEAHHPDLRGHFGPRALAILTGRVARPVPC